MLSINFNGNSIQEVAREARQFADLVLSISEGESGNRETGISYDGYRPDGVGRPERQYAPVDNGHEWNEEAITDWVNRLTDDSKEVVKILARKRVIDPREEARNLGWSGSSWAGVWTGPRRQASYVMDSRGFRSWPYGHTYEEPRRLWMHESIAEKVLNVLGEDEE